MSTLGFCRLLKDRSLKNGKKPSSHIIHSLGGEYLTGVWKSRKPESGIGTGMGTGTGTGTGNSNGTGTAM